LYENWLKKFSTCAPMLSVTREACFVVTWNGFGRKLMYVGTFELPRLASGGVQWLVRMMALLLMSN
jgi:hypothetical protein